MQTAAPTGRGHAEGAEAKRRSGEACGRMLRIRLDLTVPWRRGPRTGSDSRDRNAERVGGDQRALTLRVRVVSLLPLREKVAFA